MRQTISLAILATLVCTGTAVAQMPLDSSIRERVGAPLPLMVPAIRSARSGEATLLVASAATRGSNTIDVFTVPQEPSATQRISAPYESDARPSAAPTSTRHNFSGAQAEAYLAKYGYRNVTGLRQEPGAIWRGLAVRNGRNVEVAVDYQGNILER